MGADSRLMVHLGVQHWRAGERRATVAVCCLSMSRVRGVRGLLERSVQSVEEKNRMRQVSDRHGERRPSALDRPTETRGGSGHSSSRDGGGGGGGGSGGGAPGVTDSDRCWRVMLRRSVRHGSLDGSICDCRHAGLGQGSEKGVT